MLIDWFTVGAQALNFVILVWLMRRFLYKPILHAIDAREELIAAKLADAAATKTAAHEERDELQHKNDELDEQRADLLKAATDEASTERQRLIAEARAAATALGTKRQEALRAEAARLEDALQRRTQREVFAIARQALTDLASVSLDERLVSVFTRRLRELDGPAKADLAGALAAAPASAVVRCAFDLPADQQAAVRNALNEAFSADVEVRFETAPDLVSGIELVIDGRKLGWNISEYLQRLQDGIDELLTPTADVKAG